MVFLCSTGRPVPSMHHWTPQLMLYWDSWYRWVRMQLVLPLCLLPKSIQDIYADSYSVFPFVETVILFFHFCRQLFCFSICAHRHKVTWKIKLHYLFWNTINVCPRQFVVLTAGQTTDFLFNQRDTLRERRFQSTYMCHSCSSWSIASTTTKANWLLHRITLKTSASIKAFKTLGPSLHTKTGLIKKIFAIFSSLPEQNNKLNRSCMDDNSTTNKVSYTNHAGQKDLCKMQDK